MTRDEDEVEAIRGGYYSCNKCGAYDLEPGEKCDCTVDDEEDDDFFVVGGVPMGEVPAYTREEFYDMLADDPRYQGLVDPDDFENILIATVISLDVRYQQLLKKQKELEKKK
jgi:hypothetical protein